LPSGIVLQTPNLPCWRNFPLGDRILHTYGLRTHIDNDANAAGLAEALWGAGRGHASVFYATIGTGIGTAIVLNQRIYYGRTGEAAEGGHMSIDFRGPCHCGCGKRGCLEGLASGPAIARRTRERIASGADGTAILAAAGGDVSAVTAKAVESAFRAGDSLAIEVMRETADLLAVWMGNIIDLLEPDIIVVGGGVGKLVSEWFDHIRRQLPSWCINTRCQEIPIVCAHYGVDAGIAGAAALCFVEHGLGAAGR
jgi:glucokinase